MIVDSSALVAVLLQEPGAEELARLLEASAQTAIGALTLLEAHLVLESRLGPDADALLQRLQREIDLAVLPFTPLHAEVALSAWRRFGKGRHPAALNLGDCCAYATARVADRPLLCVGEDFPRTDLPLVPVVRPA